MIGFFSDYAGGKLKADPGEVAEAAFFTVSSMPKLPSKISLARKMTDAWIKEQKKRF